jgi:hypothetical protein
MCSIWWSCVSARNLPQKNNKSSINESSLVMICSDCWAWGRVNEMSLKRTRRNAGNREVVNRKAFVEAVTTVDHILPDPMVRVNLNLWKKPLIENLDQVPDTSILDNYKKTMLHPSCLVQRIQDRKMPALHNEAQMQFNSLTLLWCLALLLLFWVVITIEKTAIKKVTSDWLQPQIWLIILVLLADHDPNIPKFQVESGITKFKKIFQGTDAVSKLIEHLHGLLTATPSSRPHQLILSIVCGLFHEFRITLRI